MNVYESIRVAIGSLWANKLRAALTMLGVIIGVFSVIIMVALVQGLRQKFVSQFASNGANLIYAFYDPPPDAPQRGFAGLTMDDVRAVSNRCTLVATVSPSVTAPVTAQAGANRQSLSLHGVTASWVEDNALLLTKGRALNADDTDTYGKAVLLGAKVERKLFGTASPVGKTLLCSTGDTQVAMIVVGVLAQKDANPGTDYDNGAFAALPSVQKRFLGTNTISSFTARSKTVDDVTEAADQVWAVIKQRHPLVAKNFTVDTQDSLINQISSFLGYLQAVLGGIAGLALLTGGIGIMNIMLVSVTERTREIGVRKAVGATRSSILTQFMVEAVVVSGLGGVLGVAGGYGVSALVNFAQQAALHNVPVPMYVPLWTVGLGVGFAMGVGLFFGIYPAYRAASLDPIAALRYE